MKKILTTGLIAAGCLSPALADEVGDPNALLTHGLAAGVSFYSMSEDESQAFTPASAYSECIHAEIGQTYCARIAHYPIQAPIEYQQRPNIAAIDVPHRMVYHAQIEFLDEQIGNLTGLFKTRGMWEDTLMVLHSDNVCAMPSSVPSYRCRAS